MDKEDIKWLLGILLPILYQEFGKWKAQKRAKKKTPKTERRRKQR